MKLYAYSIIALCGATLIFAVVVTFAPHANSRSKDYQLNNEMQGLEMRLDLRGLVSRKVPLGSSSSEERAVRSVLEYDSVLHQEFEANDARSGVVSLLVFHWHAGKKTPMSVLEHTPAICWPETGWKFDSSTSGQRAALLDSVGLNKYMCQSYVAPSGQSIFTIYWLIVDGETYDWSEDAQEGAVRRFVFPVWARQKISALFFGAPRMTFVRLTSADSGLATGKNKSFDNLIVSVVRNSLVFGAQDSTSATRSVFPKPQ